MVAAVCAANVPDEGTPVAGFRGAGATPLPLRHDMNMHSTRTAVVLMSFVLMSLAATAHAQGKIHWQTDLSTALAKAEKDGKPIVACISMRGERVCDVIVAEHYADPKIVELSRNTINLFCSPHGSAEQQELEKRVRIDLLKKGADDWMVPILVPP